MRFLQLIALCALVLLVPIRALAGSCYTYDDDPVGRELCERLEAEAAEREQARREQQIEERMRRLEEAQADTEARQRDAEYRASLSGLRH